MILVDTSVWIDHWVVGVPELTATLGRAQVLMHPFVIGELACGHLKNRQRVLSDLHKLPASPSARQAEVLDLIERHRLMGKGLNLVDVHLLAATLLTGGTRLWTRDQRLHAAATALHVSYVEYDA